MLEKGIVCLSALSFNLIWINAFFIRFGYLSKIGTLFFIVFGVFYSFSFFKKDWRKLVCTFVFFVLMAITIKYPVKDLFLSVVLMFLLSHSASIRKSFSVAIKMFALIAAVFILLSLFDVYGVVKTSHNRWLGRYVLGFVTPFHLAEFSVCMYVYFIYRKSIDYRKLYLSLNSFLVFLTASRVIMLSVFLLWFEFIFKRNVVKKVFVCLLLFCQFILFLSMFMHEDKKSFYSSRDLVSKGIFNEYSDAIDRGEYYKLIVGIKNNKQLADDVSVKRWESSVPLDGFFIQAFSSGLLGGVMFAFLMISLFRVSVLNIKKFIIFSTFLVFGVGANMFNLWHILTPLCFYCLYDPKNNLSGNENAA
ncbi:hypothetical protein ACIGBN_14155 [Marinomonas sp. NPDC078689]|uniref:hypothetical protein n=1 Tax=Marinomonas sp. NPDC078689 TaxID=3364147 RepID=UPI0037CAA4C0